MEHFALTRKQADDAMDEDIWWLINERAKKNALIYREVFACYPDDTAKNLQQFKEFRNTAKADRY